MLFLRLLEAFLPDATNLIFRSPTIGSLETIESLEIGVSLVHSFDWLLRSEPCIPATTNFPTWVVSISAPI